MVSTCLSRTSARHVRTVSGNLSRRCRQVRTVSIVPLCHSEARIPLDAVRVQWQLHFPVFVPQWLWQITCAHSGHRFKLFPFFFSPVRRPSVSSPGKHKRLMPKACCPQEYSRAAAYFHEKVAGRPLVGSSARMYMQETLSGHSQMAED